jgi:hypothetical protein|tara:strand:- start:99 stop:554 length:456 start_codon:yes stop_codon:yes gene_type:complete
MKYLITLLVSLSLIYCGSSSDKKIITPELVNSPLTANRNAVKVSTPYIEMLETSFDFGEIHQGESVTHEFILKNSGDADLIITAAKGSCGCTVPEWPKSPISEGEEAVIKVTFNSTGKSGKQNKTVTLVTNSIPNTKVITINGNVIVPQKK